MRDTLSVVVDLAVIVGSLGTFGALTVAALTYYGSTNDRRRAQAERIFALPVSWKWSADLDKKTFWWDPFEATISNRSELPIFDVSIEQYDANGALKADRVFPVVMPDSETSPVNFPKCLAASAGQAPTPGALPDLRVGFTDNAGRRWVRGPGAELRQS